MGYKEHVGQPGEVMRVFRVVSESIMGEQVSTILPVCAGVAATTARDCGMSRADFLTMLGRLYDGTAPTELN